MVLSRPLSKISAKIEGEQPRNKKLLTDLCWKEERQRDETPESVAVSIKMVGLICFFCSMWLKPVLWIFMRNRFQSVQKLFCVFVFVGSVKNQRHLSISLEFLMLCGTFTNCVAEWNNSSNSSFLTRDCISFGKSTLLSHKDSLLPRNSENSQWQCPQHLKQPDLKFCLSAELPSQRTENPPLNL